MNWRQKLRPMTGAQLAVEHLLTRLAELPVGQTAVLVDRTEDGAGALVVKRHSKHTLIFKRAGCQAPEE